MLNLIIFHLYLVLTVISTGDVFTIKQPDVEYTNEQQCLEQKDSQILAAELYFAGANLKPDIDYKIAVICKPGDRES